MKVVFHQELLDCQRYGCLCCGAGCRSFLIPVRPYEQEAIEALTDWRTKLGVGTLFVKTRQSRPWGVALAKHADGRCVFLGADNLCEIHRSFGLAAKPLACQLFPFVLTPFGDEIRVGLRFECQAVAENKGKVLTDHRRELNGLIKKLTPEGKVYEQIPEVYRGCRTAMGRLDYLNETLIKIISSDAMGLRERLEWLRRFAEQLGRIKWQRIEEESNDDFEEFVTMLRGSTLAEAQRQGFQSATRLEGKGRGWFGQFLFLVCQPPSAAWYQQSTWRSLLRDRWEMLRRMKAMGKMTGPVPRVRQEWPAGRFEDLEGDWGVWPDELQRLVTRYLLCRLAGMNYMGVNFYGYSMSEGITALLAATAALGWLMRLYARGEGRTAMTLADAQRAIRAIDGNLGYSQHLAFGPARLRLEHLKDHLPELLGAYA